MWSFVHSLINLAYLLIPIHAHGNQGYPGMQWVENYVASVLIKEKNPTCHFNFGTVLTNDSPSEIVIRASDLN